ncbi:MAG: recombinase family protein [Oscillospiraceae bacterium]|nr:recombinase family protein [Oscillospiraceae bacterium]MDE6706612.1 recombinase family protein [Oscillospiraceae bacterium]
MHRIFIDKCSGKNTDRPELKKMLDYLGGGNFLVVSEYVRLARSSADMLDL